jgi:hypothetical protein
MQLYCSKYVPAGGTKLRLLHDSSVTPVACDRLVRALPRVTAHLNYVRLW